MKRSTLPSPASACIPRTGSFRVPPRPPAKPCLPAHLLRRRPHSCRWPVVAAAGWVVSLCLPGFLPTRTKAAIPLAETGMLSFADWGPDATGTAVVSDLLEKAIEQARVQNKTLYLPPGTYLIDRTITFKATHGGFNQEGMANVFGDLYHPPVIRLKDGTFTGSPAAGAAQPVFRLVNLDPTKSSAWSMFSTFRNIRIDLGHNPGAAGIRFPAAQDSHLINVHITGKAFTTGIIGFAGRNQANLDLSVEGGRFGVVLTEAAGINVTGLRLKGQSEIGMIVSNVRGSTVVGFSYEGPGTAIETKGDSYEQGNLYLEDARICITTPGQTAIRASGRPIVIRHVFIKGAEQLIAATPRGLATASPGTWTRIDFFANSPSPVDGRPVFLSEAGSRLENEVRVETSTVASPPVGLVQRHLPGESFAFNHPETVNALDYPGATASAKFQAALDSAARVIYIPAGRHLLDEPLTVPLGKVLLGDPGKYTFLVPTYSPTGHTFLLSTAAGDGAVVVENLFLSTRDLPFEGGMHWRCSGGHWLNNRIVEGAGRHEHDQVIYQFSGDAGGKMYAVTDHRNILKDHEAASDRHRKVRVDGTRNPLTFYGLNLERGGGQRGVVAHPFVEIRNARNVRIYGMKSEPDEGPPVRLENVRNLLITSLGTHRNTSAPFIAIAGMDNSFELALVMGGKGQPTVDLITPYTHFSKQDVLVHLVEGEGYQREVFTWSPATLAAPNPPPGGWFRASRPGDADSLHEQQAKAER